MISDKKILEAWEARGTDYVDQEWFKRSMQVTARFRDMPEDEFRRANVQEELWRARVGGVGAGNAISLNKVFTDESVVSALVELRATSHEDRVQRDSRIVESYYRILNDIKPRLVPTRPRAMLLRVFYVLVPDAMTQCFSPSSVKDLADMLLGRPARGRFVETHVEARARLRKVLGPEENLEEHVRRSTFGWWLHRRAEELRTNQPLVSARGGDEGEEDSGELSIWPFAKQRKGMQITEGGMDLHQAIVRQAINGATPEELLESLKGLPETEGRSQVTVTHAFHNLNFLGLFERRNGLLFPSAEGDELLEDDFPAGLTARLLERVYGAAQALREFADASEPEPRASVAERLMKAYPSWTTRAAPYAMIRWCVGLGLVDFVDSNPGSVAQLQITDYGRAWASRLPKELPLPPAKSPADEIDEEDEQADSTALMPMPSIAEIRARFAADPELSGFVFSPLQLASLHAAWNSSNQKRFVLLSGLSGTGKTAITRCYAKAVCDLLELDLAEHMENVAVSPDWMDPTGLLGFLNTLHHDPSYRMEPALRLVLRAKERPEEPFFLILDEMNLARVERYFAPFLSAMETGGDLVLHSEIDDVHGVPARVRWPRNLFIAGTVNMDESTHAFSDKVLDRAFTLEFWEVELEDYFARHELARDPSPAVQNAIDVLLELHAPLRSIRRHFGYRTAGEVLSFVAAADDGESEFAEMLDQAVFSKVLPRLRGDEQHGLVEAMEQLVKVCEANGLETCRAKLEAMSEQLAHVGVMRFWS